MKNSNLAYNPITDMGLGFNDFLKHTDLKKNDSVLIFGCGTGDDAFSVRRIVGEEGWVIGLDYSMDKIGTARQMNGNLGYNNVTFFVADNEKTHLTDERFDVVICNYFINLLPQRTYILQEFDRLLKPTGHIVLADFFTNKSLTTPLNSILNVKYLHSVGIDIIANQYAVLRDNQYSKMINDTGFSSMTIIDTTEISNEYGELMMYFEQQDLEEIEKLDIRFYKKIIRINK